MHDVLDLAAARCAGGDDVHHHGHCVKLPVGRHRRWQARSKSSSRTVIVMSLLISQYWKPRSPRSLWWPWVVGNEKPTASESADRAYLHETRTQFSFRATSRSEGRTAVAECAVLKCTVCLAQRHTRGLPRRRLFHDDDQAGGSRMETEPPRGPPQPDVYRPNPLRFSKIVQVALERLSV